MGFFYDPYICAGIGFAVGIFVGFALRGRSFLFTRNHFPRAIQTKQRFSKSNTPSSLLSQTIEDTAQSRAERAINRSFEGLLFQTTTFYLNLYC